MRFLLPAVLAAIFTAIANADSATPQRQRRESPPQRQVERTIDYFVGKWRVDYLGAEVPPVSVGSHSGTVTFTKQATSSFIAGQFDGEVNGKPFREMHTIGLDPETFALVAVERRPDGTEIVSIGRWQSPLAITWQNAPIAANGKSYQVRRMTSIRSDVAFEVTEEYSVDGGPMKRLGSGRYTKE
jgi:hypothetical protein